MTNRFGLTGAEGIGMNECADPACTCHADVAQVARREAILAMLPACPCPRCNYGRTGRLGNHSPEVLTEYPTGDRDPLRDIPPPAEVFVFGTPPPDVEANAERAWLIDRVHTLEVALDLAVGMTPAVPRSSDGANVCASPAPRADPRPRRWWWRR